LNPARGGHDQRPKPSGVAPMDNLLVLIAALIGGFLMVLPLAAPAAGL
jgi:hypothetical protein